MQNFCFRTQLKLLCCSFRLVEGEGSFTARAFWSTAFNYSTKNAKKYNNKQTEFFTTSFSGTTFLGNVEKL